MSKENIPFTMVANSVLVRTDISLKAKGLFAYLFSKPDGWEFSAERMAAECQEERKAIQRVLKELEEASLLVRIRQQSGKMDYRVQFAAAAVQNDTAQLFAVVEPKVPRELARAAKNMKVGDVAVATGIVGAEGAVVNDLIDLFKPMNPAHDRLFRNKSQRGAMERLLVKHGEKKVRGAIAAAQACYGKAYCPTITTPVELEAKMGQLVAAVHKSGQGRQGVVSLG